MKSTSSWLLSFALAALIVTIGVDDAGAQRTPERGRTTTPPTTGPAGLPGNIDAAPVAAKVYALPQISYGAPMPPPASAATSRKFDEPLARFETVSIAASVAGRSVTNQLTVLNGRQGIENASIRDDA